MSDRVSSPTRGEICVARPAAAAAGVLPLFTVTLFLSALLLFWVQPMAARMVLPLLGGSSAVWTTAMVFFQVSLLAGYAFAHVGVRTLGLRTQALLHLIVVVLALMTLPFGLNSDLIPPSDSLPVFWLIALLAGMVGLPFFAIAATAPAVQAWFAGTGHPDAHDPYFLYGASNLGSLLALLGYPLVIEPLLPVERQVSLWGAGYAMLVVLIGLCILILAQRTAGMSRPSFVRAADRAAPANSVAWAQRLRWMALACVPSSLMLGVTSHLTTDVAAVPLLWVIPLALYLLTFVLVFARRPQIRHTFMVWLQPYAIGLMVVAFWLQMPIKMAVPIHLIGFFTLAMVCHGELAARRPPAARLTEFYLWMSIGGALGGGFNALVAPMVFDAVYEYPLAIAAACLLLPRQPTSRPDRDRAVAVGVLAVLSGFTLLVGFGGFEPTSIAELNFALTLLPPTLLLFTLRRRPSAFALGVAVVLVVPTAIKTASNMIVAERSFYGVHRVKLDDSGDYRLLLHGTTVHGAQHRDPARSRDLLTYYDSAGPVGQVIPRLADAGRIGRVGVVGLGSGNLACYRRPGQEWTFFEIDPTVVRIARDSRNFNYLESCAPNASIVLGDARVTLSRLPAAKFDLLIVDAFSSDAIPIHLLTREAMALYFEKLSPRGVLLFHVSNRALDLVPVLARLADDAGVAAWSQYRVSKAENSWASRSALWVVLARVPGDLDFVDSDPRWRRLSAEPGAAPWTDAFSNIVSVVRW